MPYGFGFGTAAVGAGEIVPHRSRCDPEITAVSAFGYAACINKSDVPRIACGMRVKGVVNSFATLKRKSESGETLEQLGKTLRFNLGMHKRTRLAKAGAADSGSLLHDAVSKVHAERLSSELQGRALRLGDAAEDRLRFMTVLEELVDPNIKAVEAAVAQLEAAFVSVAGGMRLWARGAIELELVNIDLLRRIKGDREDEARKLDVLERLSSKRISKANAAQILVHAHAVVDLGAKTEANEAELRKRMKQVERWNSSSYQVELKKLFREKSTAKNLDAIAAYVTKGGNENLRYSAGFGRDLAEDLDAKMWRAGGSGRSARGGETIDDERGLTIAEVKQLDELYVWLMSRRRDKRGYIISSGIR